jgi:hypothetical protein
MTTTKERTRKISSNKRKRTAESDSDKPQTRLKKENPTQEIIKEKTTTNNKPWQNNGTYVDMDTQSNSLLIVFDFRKILSLMSPEDREKYLPFLKDINYSETASV